MQIEEAKAECQRWLDYLQSEEERSIAWQRLAADRRAGRCDAKELRRRRAEIDSPSVRVYDGAKLADAVRVLLKRVALDELVDRGQAMDAEIDRVSHVERKKAERRTGDT